MHPHFLFLLLSFLLLPSASLQDQQGADDVRSLLEFKKGIRSDPKGVVFGTWTAPASSPDVGGDCPSSWHGVSCDDAGTVVSVALDGLGLSGDLKFSTLVGMKSLQTLTLANNNFTGRLAPALGSIVSLQRLDLSGNQFFGPVPAKITGLWGLNHLNLSFNNFNGGFPKGIGNLQQLKVLDVRSNGLWGDVGSVLSEIRNAEHIDLSANDFYGGLSDLQVSALSLANTAKYMNLSYNRLNGGFFESDTMRLFRNLEVLDLSHNELNGMLPELSSLSNLRVLRVMNNQMYGLLREELFGNLMPLKELDLSRNGFTGSIFNINSTSLMVLNLSANALSGHLPSSVGSCVTVDLSSNLVSGDLSFMQNWSDSLENIDLSSNKLSGGLVDVASKFEALISINMKNNSLEGTLPFGNHRSVSNVDLSLNKFDGFLPPGLFTSLNLTNLNLSGNQFTGPIPLQNPVFSESLVLTTSPHIESLDLSDNYLNGSLPPDIVTLQKLKLLNLRKNSLSGDIPSEISKLNALEYLDLSSNHFNGEIPDIAQFTLKTFNVSNNNLTGTIPSSLKRFPDSSFHPGNVLLNIPGTTFGATSDNPAIIDSSGEHHHLKSRIRVAIIVGSIGGAVLIFFIFMAIHRIRSQELCGRNGFRAQTNGRDLKFGRFTPNIFQSNRKEPLPVASMNFSNDQLLNSSARSMPVTKQLADQTVDSGFSSDLNGVVISESVKNDMADIPGSGFKSSPGSPMTSSPHFMDPNVCEQPVVLNVYSPDRLVGELLFLDNSVVFTAEDLSRAPAEVLGRSSHGTSYKATLDNGHMLTVKWLRVGLVKRKKEFAKEVKKIGMIRHPNIISLRGYYWGPREQERLLLSDYVVGDSLALHLYESTPRRYSRLTFSQRLKVAIDIARCLCYLHYDKGLPHGNLKPTNILLSGPDLTARLTDYGLHHLMTLSGTAEQLLNLGALGYRAPELASATKPLPSFKADVYSFGVIMMELLTKRSAGDIISGQSGAVDLTDWVGMCAREGRGAECFDRDIAGLEEAPRAMNELLAVALRCILPVNERPNMKGVFEELCSIKI